MLSGPDAFWKISNLLDMCGILLYPTLKTQGRGVQSISKILLFATPTTFSGGVKQKANRGCLHDCSEALGH